jgi:hypothetical protein
MCEKSPFVENADAAHSRVQVFACNSRGRLPSLAETTVCLLVHFFAAGRRFRFPAA